MGNRVAILILAGDFRWPLRKLGRGAARFRIERRLQKATGNFYLTVLRANKTWPGFRFHKGRVREVLAVQTDSIVGPRAWRRAKKHVQLIGAVEFGMRVFQGNNMA